MRGVGYIEWCNVRGAIGGKREMERRKKSANWCFPSDVKDSVSLIL